MKGPYRFARCRYLGLARNDTHFQFFPSVYNPKTPTVLVRCGGFSGELRPMIEKKDENPWRRQVRVTLDGSKSYDRHSAKHANIMQSSHISCIGCVHDLRS